MEPVNEHLLCRKDWVRVRTVKKQYITQVKEVYIDGIQTLHGEIVLWDDVFGIELSRDWLQAAGFEEFGYDVFGHRDFACAIIADGSFLAEVNGAQIAVVSYVHQLQRLYGAIKQRALIIPLPAPNA